MTSDTMSLSCQISCFPPDCIKENIRQLALGELLVQKKNQTKNVYFINLLYRTFQGHKAFIYISSKVIIFFPIDITLTVLFCVFSSSLSHWKLQKSLWQTKHFTSIPVQSGSSMSSSEEQRMCQSQSSVQWLSCSSPSKPSIKCIAAIICLTIASLEGCGAPLC